MSLPPDVAAHIQTTFPPGQREEAEKLLTGATIHDGTPASPRLLRCALIACGGRLESLRSLVGDLRKDYRDVILEGEYEVRQGKLIHVRNLVYPIPPQDQEPEDSKSPS